LCYYRALQLGPASRVAPTDKPSVVFAVLVAAAFLGERLTWKVGLGKLDRRERRPHCFDAEWYRAL
jgi:bacterial/archaeal transporter family protein